MPANVNTVLNDVMPAIYSCNSFTSELFASSCLNAHHTIKFLFVWERSEGITNCLKTLMRFLSHLSPLYPLYNPSPVQGICKKCVTLYSTGICLLYFYK